MSKEVTYDGKPLTAEDRTLAEKLAIGLQGSDYNYDNVLELNLYNTNYSNNNSKKFSINKNTNEDIIQNRLLQDLYIEENYGKEYLEAEKEYNSMHLLIYEIHSDDDYYNTATFEGKRRKLELDRFKQNEAFNASAWYREYYDHSWLTLNDKQWGEIKANYEYLEKTQGKQAAKDYVNNAVYQNIAENQGVLAKLYAGFSNMGATVVGSLEELVGIHEAIGSYIFSSNTREKNDVEGVGFFGDLVNTVLNNETFKQGERRIRYGSLSNQENIKHEKEGTQNLPIFATEKQQNQWFSVNTIPEVIGSHGFSIATTVASLGGSGIIKGVTWGARKGASKIMKKAASETSKQVIKATSAFLKAGAWGTMLAVGALESFDIAADAYNQSKLSTDELIQNAYNKELLNEIEYLKATAKEQGILYASELAIEDVARLNLEKNGTMQNIIKHQEALNVKAARNALLLSYGTNFLLDCTLTSTLYTPFIRKHLKKVPNKIADVTVKGGKAVNQVKKGRKFIYGLKEPVGEAIEEMMQTAVTEASVDASVYNMSNFIEALYNGNSAYEIGDYISGTFLHGLSSFGESLVSEETLKAGMMGFLGSALPMPGIKTGAYFRTKVDPETGKVKRKLDLRKREGESRFLHIARVLPFRSGYMEGVRDYNTKYEDAELFRVTLQNWLDEGNSPETVKDLIRSLSLGEKVMNSVEDGDDQEFRNSVMSKLISDAVILKRLKGTDFYNTYMQVLDDIIKNEDPNSEFAKLQIKNIRENGSTAASFDVLTTSDELIYNNFREHAVKVNDVLNAVWKESENLDKMFGNIDSDVKHSLIYGSLMLKEWLEAKTNIEKDVNRAYSLNTSDYTTSLSRKNRKHAENLMSYYMAVANRDVLEEKLKEVELRIETLKNTQGLEQRKAESIAKAEEEKKAIQNQIKYRDKTLSLTDLAEFADSIETILDIMRLPIDVKYKLLNPKNTERLPSGIKELVIEANNKALQEDMNIHKKLENLYKIDKAINNYNKEFNTLFSNPEAWNDYLFLQRLGVLKFLAKKQSEILKKAKSYQEFEKLYEEVLFENNSYKTRLINEELKDFLFYKKFNKNAEKINNFIDFNAKGKSKTFNLLSMDYRDLIFWAIRYLKSKGVEDFTDLNTAYSKMFGDPNDTFELYMANMNVKYAKDNPKVRPLPLPDNIEFFESYKLVISEYILYNKDLLNAVPSKPSDTPLETPAKKAEEKRVKEQLKNEKNPFALEGVTVYNDEGKPLTFDFEDDNFKDEKDDLAFFDDDVKKDNEREEQRKLFIKRLLKGKKVELSTETLVNSFIELFDIASEEELLFLEEVSESFLEPLTQEELDLIERERDKDSYSKDARIAMLHKGWTEKEHKLLYFLSDIRRPKQESNKDITGYESGIEALPITNITHERWPLMFDFITKHGVKEYLQENEISVKLDIYFIVYEELFNSEYIQNMDDLQKRIHLPIIVAVKKEGGTYQPIGIMPSGANLKLRGHKRLDSLRHIIINLMNLNMFKFGEPVEVNDAPLVSNLSHKSDHEHTAKTDSNKDIQDVFINDLPLEDRNSLNSSRSSENSENILKGIKDKFLKGLKVDEEGGRKILYYVNELGLKYLVKTKSIKETTSSSDLYLIDLFNARSEVENTRDVKYFNNRTLNFFNSLHYFFNNNNIILNKLVVENDSITYDTDLEKKLNNVIKNYFVLDSQYELKLDISKGESGLILLELKLTYPKNEKGETVLTMPIQNKYSDELLDNTIADLLLNLVFVEKDGKLNYRMNGTSPVVHWSISYDKMTSKDKEDSFYHNSIYDSNILAFSNESVKSGIPKVVVAAPNTSMEDPANLFKDYVEDDSEKPTEVKEQVQTSENLIKKEEIIRNEGAPTDEIKDASDMKAVTLGRKSLRRSSNKNTKTDNKGLNNTKVEMTKDITKENVLTIVKEFMEDYLKEHGILLTETLLFVKINEYLQENSDKVGSIDSIEKLHNYVDTKDMLNNILNCIKK